MYGWYILCRILKVPLYFDSPYKMFYSYSERYVIYWEVKKIESS